MIPWLADVLRAAGLTVVEHSGWKSREASGTWEPEFGVVHATAAPKTQTDETQVRIVRDGREGLPGPIANACVDRQGRWHVLAAGRCNTTLQGTAGPFIGKGNRYALGVEACNDNLSEPWPDVQYVAYYEGWAAICRRMGWTASNLVGHKEHTPGHKTDPTFNMGNFRTNVALTLAGQEEDVNLEDPLWTVPAGHPSGLPAGVRTVKEALIGADSRTALLANTAFIKNLIDGLKTHLDEKLAELEADVNSPMDAATRALLVAEFATAANNAVATLDVPTVAEIADAVNDDAAARMHE